MVCEAGVSVHQTLSEWALIISNRYEKLSGIASTLCNVAYYCQLNCCHTRVKQLIASFICQPVNGNGNVAELSNEHAAQGESLSSKVVELSTQTSALEKQIKETLSSLGKFSLRLQKGVVRLTRIILSLYVALWI